MDTDWCNWLAEGLVGNGCQYLSIALEEETDHVQNLINQVAEKFRFPLKAEKTISEKIGYEIALTYSYGKKRSAFLTHGFSLPIAMDPLMSSIYTGVAGGFVVIALDTTPPLPYSSYNDPVSLGMFAKMPVLEPSDFRHLPGALKQAFTLSETYETPVMLHLDTKIPGGPHTVTGKTGRRRKAEFEKNPARWAATPRFRFLLHKKLNQRLKDISESDSKTLIQKISGKSNELGIICNYTNLPLIEPWAQRHGIPILSVRMPFPLPVKPISRFIKNIQKALIIEDRFPTMQFQLPERKKLLGRMTDARFCREFSWQGNPLLSLLDEIITGKKKSEEKSSSPQEKETHSTPLAKFLSDLKTKKSSIVIVADKTPLTMGLPADHFVSRGGAISFAAGCSHADTSESILSITDSAALLHYGIQATTNAIYNTASVKCLLLIQPEYTQTIQTFLNTMADVKVVPLNIKAKNASKKIKEPSSQPVTFYTVSTEEAA
jgi:indolepyruvate ferredoxin oxidoreductase alpha subunit